jgi:hypothetical protein
MAGVVPICPVKGDRMTPHRMALLAAVLVPALALAQTPPPGDVAAIAVATDAAAGAGDVVSAQDVTLGDFLWRLRPVVIFADSPDDPLFRQQMRLIEADSGDLAERDVVVVTDTDPSARSAVRIALRPRGFSLVLMDKDGEVKLRKPRPWDVREITHAIDKFPLRRQEMLDQRPAGR